jgi:hypothetical protein
MSNDEAADDFGDLGYYGVSESSKSVHPAGNPMSHSTHVGFNLPPIADGSAVPTLFSKFCRLSVDRS